MSLIDDKYQELGGKSGFLGSPRAPEKATPDGRGRYRHFEGGSIYATFETGAHEVHGAIRNKWAELGWERSFLGYPATDETKTPDGRGRFNHFEGGSIYWTPETGAYEVHGAIRNKWAELGWERSFLGYPTTDETSTPDGRGRYNHFQGGSIHWTREKGAWITRHDQPQECSISGRAYGPGVDQAPVFFVSLSGPNNRNLHRETKSFGPSARYTFPGLPPGRYWLTVDARGDTMVGPHPRQREVVCSGGEVRGIDFELK
jgi:uncharacterized protein with LGFP repeats